MASRILDGPDWRELLKGTVSLLDPYVDDPLADDSSCLFLPKPAADAADNAPFVPLYVFGSGLRGGGPEKNA